MIDSFNCSEYLEELEKYNLDHWENIDRFELGHNVFDDAEEGNPDDALTNHRMLGAVDDLFVPSRGFND